MMVRKQPTQRKEMMKHGKDSTDRCRDPVLQAP